jgi:hypothetical protein
MFCIRTEAAFALAHCVHAIQGKTLGPSRVSASQMPNAQQFGDTTNTGGR